MPGKVTDDPTLVLKRTTDFFSYPMPASRREAVSMRPSAPPVDSREGVRRLYTVAMMADVLGAPAAAVRHWVRGGLLVPVKQARGIEWFDFSQLVVGRTLSRLLGAGLSLREIDAKLGSLTPGGAGDAARHYESIIADGRRLSIRRGGQVLGANGQMQFQFYTAGLSDTSPQPVVPVSLPAPSMHVGVGVDDVVDNEPVCVDDLVDLAADLEASEEFAEAAEALRAALQAGGPDAQLVFMLAELLYRMGDLTAARERYYAAVELDADHLQARTSLGCVLAELGDVELAVAALVGVLRQEPDYADAHWHIAGVLEDAGQPAEARNHLRTFLDLAPESPWAVLARERLR
jgi:DNA-binding transcriptional MerR regulator